MSGLLQLWAWPAAALRAEIAAPRSNGPGAPGAAAAAVSAGGVGFFSSVFAGAACAVVVAGGGVSFVVVPADFAVEEGSGPGVLVDAVLAPDDSADLSVAAVAG